MKSNMVRSGFTLAAALALASIGSIGCGGVESEEELAQEQAAVEGCQLNKVIHYTYEFEGAFFNSDVSYNFTTGKTYLDTKRIGGPRQPQHTITPYWPSCPGANETLSLRSGGHQHLCTHVCASGGDRELHCDSSDLPGNPPVQLNLDFQNITFECSY